MEGCVYWWVCLSTEISFHMESIGILDPTNELHLFSLPFMYHLRISDALDKWSKAWNLHALSSEHGNSPTCLWTARLHCMMRFGASVRVCVLFDVGKPGTRTSSVQSAALQPDLKSRVRFSHVFEKVPCCS